MCGGPIVVGRWRRIGGMVGGVILRSLCARRAYGRSKQDRGKRQGRMLRHSVFRSYRLWSGSKRCRKHFAAPVPREYVRPVTR